MALRIPDLKNIHIPQSISNWDLNKPISRFLESPFVRKTQDAAQVAFSKLASMLPAETRKKISDSRVVLIIAMTALAMLAIFTLFPKVREAIFPRSEENNKKGLTISRGK